MAGSNTQPPQNDEEIQKNREILLNYLKEEEKKNKSSKEDAKPKTSIFSNVQSNKPKIQTEKEISAVDFLNAKKDKAKDDIRGPIPVIKEVYVSPEGIEKIHDFLSSKNESKKITEKKPKKKTNNNKPKPKDKPEAIQTKKIEPVKTEAITIAEPTPIMPRYNKEELRIIEADKRGRENFRPISTSNPGTFRKIRNLTKHHDLKNLARLLAKLFFIALTLTFFIYLLFCVLVYLFKPDNKIALSMTKFFPVPVILSSIGNVNYYDYHNIKQLADSNLNGNLDIKTLEQLALRKVIIVRLAHDYGIESDSTTAAEKRLEVAVVADQYINERAFKRIYSIKKSQTEGESIESLAAKFKMQANAEFFSFQSAVDRFGQDVLKLDSDKISDIIVSRDGYYLVSPYGRSDDGVGLRFIYVKATTLDDLVIANLRDTKAINLIN